MNEHIELKKNGQPLKLVVDIRSNKSRKTDMETSERKIEYAPGILKLITMLVEDMVRQDLMKKGK